MAVAPACAARQQPIDIITNVIAICCVCSDCLLWIFFSFERNDSVLSTLALCAYIITTIIKRWQQGICCCV
jgi:hypothetical protein